jgi:hypothetical protein
MTPIRRGTLIVAVAVAALMVLFPPWEAPPVPGFEWIAVRHWDYPAPGTFVQYAPLFAPPVLTVRSTDRSYLYEPPRHEPCVIAWRIMATQALALLLVVGVMWLITGRHVDQIRGARAMDGVTS